MSNAIGELPTIGSAPMLSAESPFGPVRKWSKPAPAPAPMPVRLPVPAPRPATAWGDDEDPNAPWLPKIPGQRKPGIQQTAGHQGDSDINGDEIYRRRFGLPLPTRNDWAVAV